MADSSINIKYKGIKPEIAAEICLDEDRYFKEDLPVPFGDLYIYPATVHDYELFSNSSSCLTLNKNTTAEGLHMSNLEFLLLQTQNKDRTIGSMWSYKLQTLCEIIFHVQNGLKCSKCGHVIAYDSKEFQTFIAKIQTLQQKSQDNPNLQATAEEQPSLVCSECGGEDYVEMIKFVKDPQTSKFNLIVDGHIITASDFDRLRQIVLFQNFVDYRDDSWIDPAVKADYEERLRLSQKTGDTYATLEKKIVCLSIATSYSFADIYKMSIRKFTLALSTVDDLINYKIMKTALMSGLTSLPKGKTLEHWIYKSDKDMYGDAYKTADQVKEATNNL